MSIIKLVTFILVLCVIVKVKRFISGIKITSDKSTSFDQKDNRKIGLDIQDADYEDV